MAIDHAEKVRLLASLCRELAHLGLHAVLSDARPALWLAPGRADPRLWVSVSPCGEFFEWWNRRGAPLFVTDPRGAARRIARDVRRRTGGAGDPAAPHAPPPAPHGPPAASPAR